MRITKKWLSDASRKIIEGQARLCAILASDGGDGLWAEHQKRYPYYVGERPARDEELLRELLYDDLKKAIPDHLTQ